MKLFFTALMFYTRIPIPKSIGYSADNLNRATRFFPLIGIIVGSIGALAFWGVSTFMPKSIAIIVSMISQIMVTGAFHEDAFADFCDGFGGGYTKERILAIMKDSRIGTYGVVGLIMMLLSKYLLLSELNAGFIPVVLIIAHTISRVVPVVLIFTSKYVSDFDRSKSKPIGEKSSTITLIVALLIGLTPLFLMPLYKVAVLMLTLSLLYCYFRYYVHKHIGGYTGDVLGALQQMSEVIIYLILIVK